MIALMAGRRVAEFIGFASGSEDATQVNAFPAGTRVGDFVIIEFFISRSISGGAGSWATQSFGNTRIAYRQLLADDLTDPITFSGPTPYIVGVWRGPIALNTTPVRDASWSYEFSWETEVLPGYTPGSDVIAIVGVGNQSGSALYFSGGAFGPFDNQREQPTSGIGYGMGSITDMGGYSGEDFNINTDAPGSANARIYELK